MNRKIKELADKARFASSKDDYPNQDVIFERFAELIIQECCNQVSTMDALVIKDYFWLK